MTDSQRVHMLMADGKPRTVWEIAQEVGLSLEKTAQIVYNLRGTGRLEAEPKKYKTTGREAPRQWGRAPGERPQQRTDVFSAWNGKSNA